MAKRKVETVVTWSELKADQNFDSDLHLRVMEVIKTFKVGRGVPATLRDGRYHCHSAFAVALALMYEHFNSGKIPVAPH